MEGIKQLAKNVVAKGPTLFGSESGISTGMNLLSLGGNLAGGYYAKKGAEFSERQLREERRLAQLQSATEMSDAKDRLRRVKATARAKAAAQGRLPYKDRSFLAFMGDQDDIFAQEQNAIRVNTNTTNKIYASKIAGARNKGSTGVIKGLTKGGRSLLTAYSDFQKVKMP